MENHTIIGYCRKSPTEDDDETRTRLLNQMVEKLKGRSLVDRVYVSPCSSADEQMRMRDLDTTTLEIEGAIGNTQGKRCYNG